MHKKQGLFSTTPVSCNTLVAVAMVCLVAFALIQLSGCETNAALDRVKDFSCPGQGRTTLSDEKIENLEREKADLLQAGTEYAKIDQKLVDAIEQLIATMPSKYRKVLRAGDEQQIYPFCKYKLGFVDVAGRDRTRMCTFQNYITERLQHLVFLQPEFVSNFADKGRFSAHSILDDMGRAKDDVDMNFIVTGVVTTSPTHVEISLRMSDLKKGNVISRGSTRLKKSRMLVSWLSDCSI